MLKEKLIYILAGVVISSFIIVFNKENTPKTFLVFALCTFPFLDLRVIPEAWGGLKIFDIITFYSFFFLLKDFFSTGTNKSNNFYLLLFLIFLIVILFGSLSSEFPKSSLIQFPKIIPIFIYARFLLIECLYNTIFYNKVIKILKTIYVISLIFLVIQMIVGLAFTFYPSLHGNTFDANSGLIRYPGFFFDSQVHGQYLAIGSFLFFFTHNNMTRKEVLIHRFILMAAFFAIMVAGSRSAFGGYSVGIIVSFFLAGKRYRIGMFALIALLVSFYVMFSPSFGVFNRTGDLSDDYLFRQSLWRKAFEIAKNHSLLGIGNGNYQDYVEIHSKDQYLELEGGEILYFNQPENGYLKILVELGYIGFGIFVLFIIGPLLKGLNSFMNGICDYKITFLVGSVISWLIAYNTVYSFADTRILFMVATLLVLILSYPSTNKTFNEEV
ncbi:MAG: O-antigen ligase family protein [Janthinobacterium lividum]